MQPPTPHHARKLGIVLFCLALLGTLLSGFHLIENWRGKRKWEEYKRQLLAQGAKLNLADFVPPPIPAQQNFAATPFFAELLPKANWTNFNRRWPETFSQLNVLTKSGRRNERQLTDLIAGRMALSGETNGVANPAPGEREKAAREVLAALKEYEPALEELRAASSRPLARYDIYYDLENPWGIHLPHLLVIKKVTQMLSVKACAELAARNTERAMQDVRLIMRIVQSAENEVFLINYLVAVNACQAALQPLWEGLVLGRWSDAQLEELQHIMLQFNFVAAIEKPLGTEQAAGIFTPELFLKARWKAELFDALTGGNTGQDKTAGVKNVVAMFIPRGWYHLEQYEHARLFQKFILAGYDATNRIIYPAVIERNQTELNKVLSAGWSPILTHRFFARLTMPAVGKAYRRGAEAQTGTHQAAIACALERYRRKHGDYPAQLAALVPEFMSAVPHDVVDGKPMRYRHGEPVVVYSLGWDEQDNGGTLGKTQWDTRGDWVWTYPAQ